MSDGITLMDALSPSIQGGREIGPPLFFKIARQLGVTIDQFAKLR